MNEGLEERRSIIIEGAPVPLVSSSDDMPEQRYNTQTRCYEMELELRPDVTVEEVLKWFRIIEEVRWVSVGSVERWQHNNSSWDKEVYYEEGPWRQDGPTREYFLVRIDLEKLVAIYSTDMAYSK